MIEVLFWCLSAIIIISAAATVFSKSIIYSAFSLIFTFLGVAGIYVLLNADFLAVTQIMVYVGGILTLLLFGVMLTNKITMMSLKTDVTNFIPGLLIAATVLTSLIYVIWSGAFIASAPKDTWNTTVQEIGKLTITQYVLPFEVVSIVLLIALIGAAYMARKDKPAND